MTKRFEYPNALIKVRDLRVGDLLKQFDGPFGTAMVKQVTEDSVVLHRPYGANGGFIYAGNQTICYTGVEETTFLKNSVQEFHVYTRENFNA
jgi:hypothetical protein